MVYPMTKWVDLKTVRSAIHFLMHWMFWAWRPLKRKKNNCKKSKCFCKRLIPLMWTQLFGLINREKGFYLVTGLTDLKVWWYASTNALDKSGLIELVEIITGLYGDPWHMVVLTVISLFLVVASNYGFFNERQNW